MASVLTWIRRRLSGKSARDIAGLIGRANAARDARQWKTARDLYQQALAARPERVGLWMQYGHMLKHCGSLDAAIDAYSQALNLAPERGDTALQLGHAFKLKGDVETARDWYVKAWIWPDAPPHAAVELRTLGMTAEQIRLLPIAESERRAAIAVARDRGPAVDPGRVFWDVSDIVGLDAADRPPTVQALAFFRRVAMTSRSRGEAAVVFDPAGGGLVGLDPQRLEEAVAAIETGRALPVTGAAPVAIGASVVVRPLGLKPGDAVPDIVRWRTQVARQGGYVRLTSDGSVFLSASDALAGDTLGPLSPSDSGYFARLERPRGLRSPEDELPVLQPGVFYAVAPSPQNLGAGVEANGQPFLWGDGWGARTDHGRTAEVGSALWGRLAAAREVSYLCRILWVPELTETSTPGTARTRPLWTTSRPMLDLKSMILRISLDEALVAADGRRLMTGFTVFPEDRDHYWFELMDAASRRRLPSVNALPW